MIRRTVYFRDEADEALWNAIKNKAEWLHVHLSASEPIKEPEYTPMDNTP